MGKSTTTSEHQPQVQYAPQNLTVAPRSQYVCQISTATDLCGAANCTTTGRHGMGMILMVILNSDSDTSTTVPNDRKMLL